MRKYSCALALLLLFFDIPLFAQSPTRQAKSYVKHLEKSAEPSLVLLNSVERTLAGLEYQLWDALKKKDIKAVNALLSEDSEFVDENNIVSKPEFTRHISSYSPSDYSLTGFKVKAATADVAIVSYKVEAKYASNPSELYAITALVTSVWVKQGGKWRLKHQHTSSMPVTKADP